MTTNEAEAEALQTAGKLWWLWLVVGVLWVIVSLIVLQFDVTSARTVGIIVGVMFLVAGTQYIVVGTQVEGWKWLWFLFGAILVIGGLVALIYPARTFLAVANVLGFIFAFVGMIWIIEAFLTKQSNEMWWLTLISGILLTVIGFWLGGQFFITKVRTLLVFAGIWALMRGIIDIVTAFQVKKFGRISTDV